MREVDHFQNNHIIIQCKIVQQFFLENMIFNCDIYT